MNIEHYKTSTKLGADPSKLPEFGVCPPTTIKRSAASIAIGRYKGEEKWFTEMSEEDLVESQKKAKTQAPKSSDLLKCSPWNTQI